MNPCKDLRLGNSHDRKERNYDMSKLILSKYVEFHINPPVEIRENLYNMVSNPSRY